MVGLFFIEDNPYKKLVNKKRMWIEGVVDCFDQILCSIRPQNLGARDILTDWMSTIALFAKAMQNKNGKGERICHNYFGEFT